MKCATATRFRTIPDTLCVRLLLAVGLLAGLIPGISARARTHDRVHAKKAAQPKRHRPEKHAGSPPAPAPLPVTTPAPAPTATIPPVTPALAGPQAHPDRNSRQPAPSMIPAASTSSIEEQIFSLTNQAREANDLGALTLDDGLTQAAQIQASAMAMLDVLNHTLPGMPQPTLASRLQFVGYDYSWAAENIAFGRLRRSERLRSLDELIPARGEHPQPDRDGDRGRCRL